ncbi:P-loop containing nucleoside triphosphate hydrolase protein [Cytidiella melzeri]|nr:P-loop containing nucleoside triphosphate hydrolase protein [Cytidiella melzeri]
MAKVLLSWEYPILASSSNLLYPLDLALGTTPMTESNFEQVDNEVSAASDAAGAIPVDAESPIYIAVMGVTGSGKTTFINAASGDNLPVGHDLESCTSEVANSKVFELDGQPVVLFDTPGFDDTELSEVEVLNRIAVHLHIMYEEKQYLSGIVYMHRITDTRFGGLARTNFVMLQKLCGMKTLKNVIITTNRWDEVNKEVGQARETAMKRSDKFFKPALDQGAQIDRLVDQSQEAAQGILRRLLWHDPAALRLQEELVDERKALPDTDAGNQLVQNGGERERGLEGELKKIQADLSAEIDEKTRQQILRETQNIRMAIERHRAAMTSMRELYEERVREWKLKLAEAQRRFAEVANAGVGGSPPDGNGGPQTRSSMAFFVFLSSMVLCWAIS